MLRRHRHRSTTPTASPLTTAPTRRPSGPLRVVFAAAFAAVAVIATMCGPVASASVAPPVAVAAPSTPAGAQLAWLLSASTADPTDLTDAEILAHFTAWARPEVDVADVRPLLATLSTGGPPTVVEVVASTPWAVRAVVATGPQLIDLLVISGSDGLIAQAAPTVRPAPAPSLRSWSEIDRTLATLAPRTQLHVSVDEAPDAPDARDERNARDDATCRPVHAVDADRARPVGSQFKLLVLGAFAGKVARGQASWSDPIAVTADRASLPSGFTQLEVGATFTSEDVAARMISISDNTAADLLLLRTGRGQVADAQRSLGIAQPSLNRPFLTTRELFQLKLFGWPGIAQLYTASPNWLQRVELALLDRLPAPAPTDTAVWTAPRALDDIEWFASPDDICRVFDSLADLAAQPGNAPVDDVLALNDGGLALDRASFPTVWFKGGSEPGLVALGYRVTTADGRVVTVDLDLSDPTGLIDELAITPTALDLVRSAIDLALTTPPT